MHRFFRHFVVLGLIWSTFACSSTEKVDMRVSKWEGASRSEIVNTFSKSLSVREKSAEKITYHAKGPQTSYERTGYLEPIHTYACEVEVDFSGANVTKVSWSGTAEVCEVVIPQRSQGIRMRDHRP